MKNSIEFPVGPLRVLSLYTVVKIFDVISGLEKGSYSIVPSGNHSYAFIYPQSMTVKQADKLLEEITIKVSHYTLEQIFHGAYVLQR